MDVLLELVARPARDLVGVDLVQLGSGGAAGGFFESGERLVGFAGGGGGLVMLGLFGLGGGGGGVGIDGDLDGFVVDHFEGCRYSVLFSELEK